MMNLAVVSLLLLQFAGTARGFHPISASVKRAIPTSTTLCRVKTDQEDFPPEESFGDSSIDWDSEWKKVVANEGKLESGDNRPGSDFYKSEAEISAIKATNKAAMKAQEVTSSVTNNIPQMSSFTGDWKFWIAILVLLSVGASVLSAPPQMTNIPTGGSPDSYFI